MVSSLTDLELSECVMLFNDVVVVDEGDDDDKRYDEIDRVLSGIIMFSTKLVLITPGSMSTTLMPYGSISYAKDSLNPSNANFVLL